MKKAISIVLVLILTLAFVPQTALAASGTVSGMAGKVYYNGYDTGVTYWLVDGQAVVDAIPMLHALGCAAEKRMGESGKDPVVIIYKDRIYIGNLEVSLRSTSGIVYAMSSNQSETVYMVNTNGGMLCGLSGIAWLLNMQYQPGPDTTLCIGDAGRPVPMPIDAFAQMPAPTPEPRQFITSTPEPVPASGEFTIITPALTEGLQITGAPSSLSVGESATLTVTENGAAVKASKWKSSSSSRASVSSKGVVKAKKAGTVKITATLKDKRTRTITLTIAPKPKTAAKGSWKAGTKSVYGAKLTQNELNAVKAVCDQVAAQTTRMNEHQKLNHIARYLTYNTMYEDWQANKYNNTAYGPLINGKGACSGYARAFKALCDAAGIGCYYVHATDSDHQWNIVQVYGHWMHVDLQASDDQSGRGPGGCNVLIGSNGSFYSYDKKAFPETKYGLTYYFTDGTLPADWRDTLTKRYDANRPILFANTYDAKGYANGVVHYEIGTEPR